MDISEITFNSPNFDREQWKSIYHSFKTKKQCLYRDKEGDCHIVEYLGIDPSNPVFLEFYIEGLFGTGISGKGITFKIPKKYL